jgi:hypothetical protein
MKRRGFVFGTFFILIFGSLLIVGALYVYQTSQNKICRVCHRPIHKHTMTTVVINGRTEQLCCPACALTDYVQTHQKVKIVSFTDYETEKPLDPEKAYLVEGSDVNFCLKDSVRMGQHKEADPIQFDRCSPSIIAFSHLQAATDFIGIHGGSLLDTSALMARMH